MSGFRSREVSLSPLVGKRAHLADVGTASRLPKWIKPQLTRLVDEAPAGDGWLHEIKFDGYRMHARLEAARRSCGPARGWTGRTSTAERSGPFNP